LTHADKILFVSVLDDPGPDRIVAEFGRRGARCEIAGPASSFAARTRYAQALHWLPDFGGVAARAFVLARRLNSFVEASAPDLIVPLDELAAGVLRDPRVVARASTETRRLLFASLGAPEGFCAARSRRRLSALADELGVRMPRTRALENLAAARGAAAEFGYPFVVKRELTAGGGGILIARDDLSLSRGWRRSQWVARAKSKLGFIEGYRGEAVAHVAQEFISGELAFRNAACRDGVELAAVNFAAANRDPEETGPSRYIRQTENAEMEQTARAIIAALGLSGFVSFDFIVDAEGRAHLLELNPRVTGSTHLGKLFGADLIAALIGSPPYLAPESPTSIALFPKAVDADVFDPALLGAPGLLHDVPWEDPEIVDSYLRWLARRRPEAARRLRELGAKELPTIVAKPQRSLRPMFRSRKVA
jgi:hypothetical protein